MKCARVDASSTGRGNRGMFVANHRAVSWISLSVPACAGSFCSGVTLRRGFQQLLLLVTQSWSQSSWQEGGSVGQGLFCSRGGYGSCRTVLPGGLAGTPSFGVLTVPACLTKPLIVCLLHVAVRWHKIFYCKAFGKFFICGCSRSISVLAVLGFC